MTQDWERDAELLDAWRAGDDRAGEQLFDRHVDAVARFFENKLRQGAEDLTQATFLALVEGKHRIRKGRTLRAYLLGTARNILRAHLRERLAVELDPDVDSMAQLDPGPSTLNDIKEEHRILLESLRRLPLAQQTALELAYWEQLSSVEIGEILGLPPTTVRTRLVAARKRLEQVMAEVAASPAALASTISRLGDWAVEVRARLGLEPAPAPSAEL